MLRPFNKLCIGIGAVPSAFEDCMSWYEAIKYVVDYLQKEVIPAVNADTKLVNELKDYVEHYFDNLDVQEEINNKLDAMAESGQLQEIIAAYINSNSVLGFNDVMDMINSENLVEGSFAKTLGFNSINDGGGKTYKIVKETSATGVDGRSKINLGRDDLYAVAINEDVINVKEYGAAGDGVTDDTASIQYCIDNFPHKTIYIPAGTYMISDALSIKAGNAEQVDLKLDKNAVIKANTEVSALLEIGLVAGSNTWTRNSVGNIVTVEGGTWDATNAGKAIYLTADRKQTRIVDVNIINVGNGYGIYIDKNVNSQLSISADALLTNVSITGDGNFDHNSCGIYIEGSDNEFENIRITSVKTAMNIVGGGNLMNNMHFTGGFSNNTVAKINNATGVIINNCGDNYFNNTYIDTYGKCFVMYGDNKRQNFNGIQVFYYLSGADSNYTVFEFHGRNYCKVTNSYFEFPNVGTRSVVSYTSELEYNTRKYPTMKNIMHFENSQATNLNSGVSDWFNCKQINTSLDIIAPNTNPWSVAMQQNKWYPLAKVQGTVRCTIAQGGDQISDVTISYSAIKATDLHHGTSHVGAYEIGLLNPERDETDNTFYTLAIKASDANSSLMTSISNISALMTGQIYNLGSTTPLENPTVTASTNMKP